MAKPKLLVLASTFPKSVGDGVPSFVLDLAFEQAKSFDVTVLTPFVKGAKPQEVIAGVKVIRYRYWPFAHSLADGAILDNLKSNKFNWLQVPFLMLGLFRNVKKLNPTLIHAHWVIPQGLIAWLAAPKAKLLITTHGGDLYALNHPLLRAMKLQVLKSAAAISTVNSEMKQRLISWGIEANKVTVLPMGVDLAAAELRVSRVPGRLAVVGRLVEKKGIQFLLSAIREGLESGRLVSSIELVIAGDGPLRSELEAQAAGLPVSFLGAQSKDKIRELFASCEIALLPSITADSGDQEGLPVTLLEAGAAGAMVIASDLPGINEVIINERSGLLVPQRNTDALLSAIIRARGDSALRAQCGERIREVVSEFDHSVVGAKYSALLKEIQ